MRIIEKFTSKQNNFQSERTPTIAFFGDSVTHGCFEIYTKNDKIETIVDTKNGYPEKVRRIFNTLYPDVPVNIINAGMSGDNAGNAKGRLKRQKWKQDHRISLFVTVMQYGKSLLKTE